MKRKRHSPEQIIRKLREAEAALAGGGSMEMVCKNLEISEAMYHRWKSQYGGMIVPTTTDQEKHKRRATTVAKRRQMPAEKRQNLPAPPTVKKDSDQRYKQIYVSIFYDQSKERRLVGVTRKKLLSLGSTTQTAYTP